MPVTAEAKPAKDRIVREHRRGGAERAAIAEINFGRKIPRATVMRLAKPGLPERCRLESAARATVVRLAGIPVAEVGFRRASVHQGPRAEIRCVAEPQIRRTVRRKVQRVIE